MSDSEKQAAFMRLYNPIHDRFARYCQTYCLDEESAKDLISESVLRAYEGFERLKEERAFLFFLFGIASRILKNQARRAKFRGLFDRKKIEALADPNTNPEQAAELRLLKEALNRLPAKQKEALILFEISGFSIKEIQQLQGGSLSAVKARLFRGRKRLSALLTDRPRAILKTPQITPQNER